MKNWALAVWFSLNLTTTCSSWNRHQVATKGYSKVLTDSALQVDFFIHLHFFLINAKTKVLSRPKPSVNMQRIHSGNTDGVNTSEIKIVSLRDLLASNPWKFKLKLDILSFKVKKIDLFSFSWRFRWYSLIRMRNQDI